LRLIPQLLFLTYARQAAAGLLFLDEIGQAAPDVQAPTYQLLGDWAIGDVSISPAVAIIGACNVDSDKNYQHQMGGPLRNRAAHTTLRTPSTREWLDNYAYKQGVHGLVTAFLEQNPQCLMFDEALDVFEHRALPTPRTWTLLGRYLDESLGARAMTEPLTEEHLRLVRMGAATLVGADIAGSLAGFVAVMRKHDLKALVDNPVKAMKAIKADERVEASWALVPYLQAVQQENPQNLAAPARLARAFTSEQLQALGVGLDMLQPVLRSTMTILQKALEKSGLTADQATAQGLGRIYRAPETEDEEAINKALQQYMAATLA
jgi:hypothetical protein